MYPASISELPVTVPVRFVWEKTAAVSGQPCIVAATTDPVLTRPMFQLLLRPASSSVVQELDATMFVAKLPSEKSLGGAVGFAMPPHPERHMISVKPSGRIMRCPDRLPEA